MWLCSAASGLVVAACWPAAVAADVPPREGTATFTDLTGGGACSFPGEPPDNLHVGISSDEFGVADVCGGYLDVVGPKGTVRVKITDHCRRCAVGLIDVTRKAFARIAEVDAGRARVSYKLARNPPLRDPISLRVSAGSSRWWFQVQVLDHGNPLRSVELTSGAGGGAWRPLVHTADNQWQASSPGPGDGPFTLRITDVYGQSATVYDVALSPAEIQHTVARLYQPAAPEPTPAPTTTPTSTVTAPSAPTVPPEPAAPPASDPRPAGRSRGGGALTPVFVVLGALALAARIYARRRGGPRRSPLQRLRQAWPR